MMIRVNGSFLRAMPACALLLSATPPLQAGPARSPLTVSPIGNPVEGGSWHQGFAATLFERPAFDQIIWLMDPGGPPFELPAFTLDGGNGWANGQVATAAGAHAEGDAVRTLRWMGNFEGDLVDSPAFAMDVFLSRETEMGAVLVGSARLHWTGGSDGVWNVYHNTKRTFADAQQWLADATSSAVHVPLPPAALLASVGLGGFACVRRGRRR